MGEKNFGRLEKSLYLCTMKKIILLLAVMLISPVAMAQTATELTNLVVFVRFADEDEIDFPFRDIDTMFNGRAPGKFTIYNFYDVLTYGQLHYNTVYPNNMTGSAIVSYQDIHPRSYYRPYSEENPDGYQGENPMIGISMRESQLLARALDYIDSEHLVDSTVVLDGDGDGYIDNISFIVKGDVDDWGDLLWPHMEFFPHDSIDHPVSINGLLPNAFNMEFEGSDDMFSVYVFRHEMGHSLNLPDLYHYRNYTHINQVGIWDMMGVSEFRCQTAAIMKSKILHVGDDPVQITADGDYTLRSAGSSPTQNCYYIKSSIDTTQWYVFEYRNKADLFEEGIPGTGLVISRWVDSIPLDREGMYHNSFFDNENYVHLLWIFRPDCSNDTTNGRLARAFFSQASGRTSFGPSTNPHPYLTNGTPEQSFEITNIQEHDSTLTFHVHFLPVGIPDNRDENATICVYPNPASSQLTVAGIPTGSRIEVFNALGCCQLVASQSSFSISALPTGVYLLKMHLPDGQILHHKIIKQ